MTKYQTIYVIRNVKYVDLYLIHIYKNRKWLTGIDRVKYRL